MSSEQLAIILMSTLLPAAAVGFLLYKSGKTTGYAVFGAVLCYAVAIALLYLLFRLWIVWPNMPFQAFLLILPLAVAALFVWQLKGRGPNR